MSTPKEPTSTARSRIGSTILVSCKVAAELLAISPRTLWTLTASGDIESVRIGRAVRYRLATLERYAEQREGRKAGTR